MGKANGVARRRFVVSAISTAALVALPARLMADAKMQKIGGNEMTTLTPYLLFDGQCHQAMEFYKSCFGGELSVAKVKDSPAKDRMPAVQHDKVVYARLSGDVEISASDWLRPDRTPIRGNTACLYLSGGTLRELEALFEKLSDGAEVSDPLKEQFFGWYGALNDKFGVRWMFQTEGLAEREYSKQNNRQHRSERHEIHFADVRHNGRRSEISRLVPKGY